MRNSMVFRWSLIVWYFLNLFQGIKVDIGVQVLIIGVMAITYAIDEKGEQK